MEGHHLTDLNGRLISLSLSSFVVIEIEVAGLALVHRTVIPFVTCKWLPTTNMAAKAAAAESAEIKSVEDWINA